MRARRRDEAHRSSTPLELFFDLSFAVAVAQAGQQLVHALAAGEPGHGIVGYLLVFFTICWAWVNFTWFASAYDTDDVPYRLVTLLQITGVLALAAGVPRAFSHGDYAVAVTGYLIMRVALTAQWLRAARGETGRARTYAAGLVVGPVRRVHDHRARGEHLRCHRRHPGRPGPAHGPGRAAADRIRRAGHCVRGVLALLRHTSQPVPELEPPGVLVGLRPVRDLRVSGGHRRRWLVHLRRVERGAAQQLVLPASAALVLAASFAGHWAVPLAALAAAAGLAVNIILVTRASASRQ
jgi:hypothetical protein